MVHQEQANFSVRSPNFSLPVKGTCGVGQGNDKKPEGILFQRAQKPVQLGPLHFVAFR